MAHEPTPLELAYQALNQIKNNEINNKTELKTHAKRLTELHKAMEEEPNVNDNIKLLEEAHKLLKTQHLKLSQISRMEYKNAYFNQFDKIYDTINQSTKEYLENRKKEYLKNRQKETFKKVSPQISLLEKFKKYMEIKIEEDPTIYNSQDIKELLKNYKKGVCSGLVTMWLLRMSTNQADELFYKDFEKITKWSGEKEDLNEYIDREAEAFLNEVFTTYDLDTLVKDIQQQQNLSDIVNFLGHATDNTVPEIEEEFGLAFALSSEELAEVLEKVVHVGKMIRIGCERHAIGVFRSGENEYVVYDPNKRPMMFSNLKQVQNALEKGFLGNNVPKHMSMNIAVYDTAQNKKGNYPDLKKLISEFIKNDKKLDRVKEAAYYMANKNRFDGIEALIGKGFDPNQLDPSQLNPSTILMQAVRFGNKEAVERLLNMKEIDLTIRDKNGETALARAINQGEKEIAALIIKNLDPKEEMKLLEFKDNTKCTPLMIAIEKGQTEIALEILNKIKNYSHAKDVLNSYNENHNALTYAVYKGNAEIVKALLTAGANINLGPTGGLSPLETAVSRHNEEIVKLLLSHSNIEISNTAVSWAKENENIKEMLDKAKKEKNDNASNAQIQQLLESTKINNVQSKAEPDPKLLDNNQVIAPKGILHSLEEHLSHLESNNNSNSLSEETKKQHIENFIQEQKVSKEDQEEIKQHYKLK